MCEDGELVLSAEHSQCLKAAVDVILGPFERTSPIVLDAHYYGALYTQSLVPWLCAWRSGSSTKALSALVKRVGNAVVHCFERVPKTRSERVDFRKRVPERLQLEYVQIAHVPIWGSRGKDPVWNAFYA